MTQVVLKNSRLAHHCWTLTLPRVQQVTIFQKRTTTGLNQCILHF